MNTETLIKPTGSLAATFDRASPLTGQTVSQGCAMTVADATAACDRASAAQPAWAALGPNARRNILMRAADLLAERGPSIMETETSEVGAGAPWANFDIAHGCGTLREAAAMTTQVGGETIPSDKPGMLAMTIRTPVGVVLGFAPWNAPIILGVRSFAMALACGNAVIVKASELCPRTHEMLIETMHEAGVPEDVLILVNNAPADAPDVVGALIAHPAIRRVNFTGSTRTGKIIAKLCAEQMKPVLLELGGKSPLIILDDADLDEAASAATFGAYMNSGQVCMATERVVVDESIADAFVDKFKARIAGLTAADPRGGPVALGSLVDPSATTTVSRIVADATAKGAVLHEVAPAQGNYLSAAFVDRVTPDMAIYHEECFGPVTTIVRVKGEAEALRVANDTEYGLSAAIYTRDIGRGLRLAAQVQSGICHINGPTIHDEAQFPFGGMKSSGYGRFGGKAGIAEFTELRLITIGLEPGQYPF
ncbi:aldehyde dehydrogenase (plasmid) [Rhizorhabdus wittichii RW1]|uniref:Aldehyde dehydrogenase n=1 Tax=Rhizorhabdus wittichii (strain DSM 6014 / CCUG 31198 / JCM 15750 / NBRC 105917 / EY 4224 / RW1) TaxID=392499 RepID=A0A9J9LGI5_RHIWR|nr:aldehyde dehydrogenase [Sphingobium sp. LB126]ABQ71659.1 aldehyde dehydrogenase [Rhizorhabdus wittichii RW1]PJG45536.1 salicylaldehyde dehydrogenase [Sphingobium sp. LB126]